MQLLLISLLVCVALAGAHHGYGQLGYGGYGYGGSYGRLGYGGYGHGHNGYGYHGLRAYQSAVNAKLAQQQEDLNQQAADLAKQAPEAPAAPEVPAAELPVAPTNPPEYGLRNKIVAARRNAYYGHGHGLYGHGYSGLGYGNSYAAGYGLGHGGVANYGYGHGLHGHGLNSYGYHGLRAYQNAVNAKLAQQQEDLNQQAADLAKQAPVAPEAPAAPEVPAAELPVAPTNPPTYGLRNKVVYSIRNRGYGHHGGYYGAGLNYGGHW